MSLRCRIALAACAVPLAATGALAQQILTLEHPNSWTFKPEVRLKAWHEAYRTNDSPQLDRQYQQDTWQFSAAAVVFPVVDQTASSVARADQVSGKLYFEEALEDDKVEILTKQYHSGTRLAKWTLDDLGDGKTYVGRSMRLDVEIPTTSYRTVFDEQAALSIGWPKGDYPADAASTFEPMMFIDYGQEGAPYDMTPIDRLIEKLTAGKDPKQIPPVTLAKWIAGSIVQRFQPSGNGFNASRTGLLEGLELMGAPEAASRMRGSPFDMVCVLAATYRRAGLPSRVVIGYDVGAAKGKDDNFLDKKRSDLQIRAWVEFALYDEASGNLHWIPVDVVEMRRRQSRLPTDWLSHDKPLKYFGTHDGLDNIVPFAFQFHPPTAVRAYGSPCFWGWGVYGEYPPPGYAWQEVRLSAQTTPSRAGDDQQERRRTGRGRGG
jgi:hypothetical protein